MQKDSALSLRTRGLMEKTILPSPHSVELERTAETDFLYRIVSRTPHAAELFQENSKLIPCSTLTVPANNQAVDEIRKWYFSTAYVVREEDFNPDEMWRVRITIKELASPLASLLKIFSRSGPVSNLLYGLDLFVLHEQRLFRIIAESDFLWVERSVTPADIQKLKTAILGVPQSALDQATSFLFVVGVLWRYAMLFGPRGYRHMLLDAGRVLAHFENDAQHHGLQIVVAQNFYDTRVDRFLFMDGVERSTLAVLTIMGEE